MHNKIKKLEVSDLGKEGPASFSGNYHVSHNHRQDYNCAQKTQVIQNYLGACIRVFQKLKIVLGTQATLKTSQD